MFSLLGPCPAKSDASLLCAVHVSWALSSAQRQMPSYVKKHSTPPTPHEPDAVPRRKKRRQKVSRVPDTRSRSHENQRTLLSPLLESGQTAGLARSKTLLGGRSVPFPRRSAQVLCSATVHHRISCTFLWYQPRSDRTQELSSLDAGPELLDN